MVLEIDGLAQCSGFYWSILVNLIVLEDEGLNQRRVNQ